MISGLEGEKLTGHYSSSNLGEADLTGTVKGKESGTIDSATAMSGKMSIAGAVAGAFTAKKT